MKYDKVPVQINFELESITCSLLAVGNAVVHSQRLSDLQKEPPLLFLKESSFFLFSLHKKLQTHDKIL